MVIDNGHHPFGPSSLADHRACPGRYGLTKLLPEKVDTDSPDAALGRAKHRACYDDLELAKLSPEDREEVELTRQAAAELVEANLPGTGKVELRFERKVEIFERSAVRVTPLTWGTADLVAWREGGKRAVLVDFKFGRFPVPGPKRNLQIAAYAAGILQDPEIGVEEVIGAILQPKNPAMAEEGFLILRDPEPVTGLIGKIIAESTGVGLNLRPNSGCRYCEAKEVCPAVLRNAIEMGTLEGTETFPDPLQRITKENIGQSYEIFASAKRGLVAFERRIKDVVKGAGGKVPGLRIGYRTGRRKVKSVGEAFDVATELIPAEKFLDCCTVSIAKVESAYAASGRAKGVFNTIADGKEAYAAKVAVETGAPSETLERTLK